MNNVIFTLNDLGKILLSFFPEKVERIGKVSVDILYKVRNLTL